MWLYHNQKGRRELEFEKLVSPSLKDLFINHIEAMILSGELQVGQQLPPERQLAQSMGVSRAVVNSGIAELEQRDVTQVSGGQLQRAGICRALMSSPKIVFADEPTGALNSKSSDEIMALFSGIHRAGTAILLVTHDAKVAARAQRVLFMQDGKIVRSLALSGAGSGNLAWNTEKVLSEMKCLNI